MIYHEIRTIVFLDDFRLFIFYLLCKIYNTNSITDIRLSATLLLLIHYTPFSSCLSLSLSRFYFKS